MNKTGIVATILLLLGVLFFTPWSTASAATDGFYTLSEVAASWDGTDGNRLLAPTADYDYAYGDEASVTYTLPWSFNLYRKPHTSR